MPGKPPAAQRFAWRRLAVLVLVGLGGGLAITYGYWRIALAHRFRSLGELTTDARPGRRTDVPLREGSGDFDREVTLPAGPLGLAWDGRRFLAGSRDDPWGFLEIVPGDPGDPFTLRRLPVYESYYRQPLSFDAVTWNGESWVALTAGPSLGLPDGDAFVVFEPETFRIERRLGAPELLGCLAWDGRGYWAATRRNTVDADEPAWLYRLDADLRATAIYTPPGVGCQGLAWDGERLWFADVFADTVYVLEVDPEPRRVYALETPFNYLAGLAWDGRSLWLVEYGDDRLVRFAGARWPPRPVVEQPDTGRPPRAGDDDVAKLYTKLRSDDWADRMDARSELERRGLPVDFDRQGSSSVASAPGPEDVEVVSWQVELQGGELYGSWEVFFGADLLPEAAREHVAGPITFPLFARYTVSVEGGELAEPVERVFDARAGRNVVEREKLLDGLGRGRYRVDLFVHVQYVDRDGTARIFNTSAMTLEVSRLQAD